MTPYVIAEIGVNHDGSIQKALSLIEKAKYCGSDAVKFQHFKAEKLASSNTPKVAYQNRDLSSTNQFDMLKRLELAVEEIQICLEYSQKIDIDFIVTPYDPLSAQEMYNIGVVDFKIASADLSDIHLHDKIRSFDFHQLYIATGMSNLSMIERTLRSYSATQAQKINLFHCVSDYPCTDSSINLKCMDILSRQFSQYRQIGYSDHSVDYLPAIVALSRGYTLFERHFTLNKTDEGPDHAASSDPLELQNYVEQLKRVSNILGKDVKEPQSCELEMSMNSKKSLIASKDMAVGTIVSLDNTSSVRPATLGISMDDAWMYLNKRICHPVLSGSPLKPYHFEE